MKTFKELLDELYNCPVNYNKSIEEFVATFHRGDTMLRLAKYMEMDIRILTLAKARCAKTVLHLMKDQRSINAVNVAEQFGLGKATLFELNMAKMSAELAALDADFDAYAASDDQASSASDDNNHASCANYIKHSMVCAAANDRTKYAAAATIDAHESAFASAAYAAAYSAAASPLYAAAIAAHESADNAYDIEASLFARESTFAANVSAVDYYHEIADAAKNANRLETAEICRVTFGELLIQLVNERLSKEIQTK